MTLAPLLALLALAAAADPASGADARAAAATVSADARAASAGADSVPAVPVPPAPGGDWDARTARLEQPKPEQKTHWYSLYDGPRLGLQLDVGAPDVSGLTLVFRPWSHLRLEAGGNFDVISGGIHGGVTLIPFHWGVVPTLHAELGHMFDGDASGYAGNGASAATKLVLKQIGYDYANTQLGLEFGSQDRFVFFVRGGVFWLWTEAKNFQQALSQSNSGATVAAQNPQLKLRGPSFNLGFLLYLF